MEKKILSGDTAVRAPVEPTVVILGRLVRRASLRRIIAQIPNFLSMPVIEEGQGDAKGPGGPRRARKPGEAKKEAKAKGLKVNCKRIPRQPSAQHVVDPSKTKISFMNPEKFRELF